jgi:predicted small metal-binding protein
MSQTFGDMLLSLFVRCSDVGLDYDCVIFGMNEKKVMDETIMHLFQYHAINPKEITSEMKSKIKENIHLYRDLVRAQILHEMTDIYDTLLPVV